jgi:hypothetical protein
MHFVYLATLLGTIVGPLVKSALRILGIGVVSYVGTNVVISSAKSAILSRFGSLDSPVQQLLGLAQIDVAINIYFAAIITRLVISGLSQTDKIGRYKFLTGKGEG